MKLLSSSPPRNLILSLALIAVLLLSVAMLPHSEYTYFIFLRWVIALIAVYFAYILMLKDNESPAVAIMLLVAFMFNPIAPFFLTRDIWIFMDIVAIGCFIFVASRLLKAKYAQNLTDGNRPNSPSNGPEFDNLVLQATEYFTEAQFASRAALQRKFKIDYGTSARIMERLEELGVVTPAEGAKPREVLTKKGK